MSEHIAEKDAPRELTPTQQLKVCKQEHGLDGNAATVYGHHGSVRVCIRIFGTNKWVYDPRWENAR